MNTKIKICGVRTLEDIQSVNEAKPDYCGFILNVPNSRRTISATQLERLREKLQDGICPVGVFVNEQQEIIIDLVKRGLIMAVQLHGKESEKYVADLKEKIQVPVIKAFPVTGRQTVEKAEISKADYVLFDYKEGGSGKSFDWKLICRIGKPFFMAGGIGIHNMKEAVERFQPYALDVSSSVETNGKKDREKILEAVRRLRSLSIEK